MASEKKRILFLFHILSMQNGYVRSFELAEHAGVTERTIKNDIKELRDFSRASGAELHAQKGKGYYLEVIDNEIYKQVKKQMTIQFMYKNNDNLIQQSRTNDILRRIVVETEYLTIDDIADELYLTKSSIKEEMHEVNEILKSFNMAFRRKNEPGYLIKGNEFHRRMLMLSLFEVHYHEAIPIYKSNDFTSNFYREDQERYDIRHIFLQVLREERSYITDENGLSRYLCLMSSRYNDGCKIEFKKEDLIWIQSFRQYKVARKVIDCLKAKFKDFDVDENEITALALIFLYYDNIPKEVNLKKEYKIVYDEALDYINDFIELIKDEYAIDIQQINDYQRILVSATIPLIIQKRFKSTAYMIYNFNTFDRHIKNSIFSINLGLDYANLFHKRFKMNLSLTNMFNISNSIRVILSKINFTFKPLRAMVTTQSGFEASYYLRDIIKGRFKRYFEKLDVYEFYDMRRINKEEYDYVILSLPYFTYKYDWPCLVINDIPTQQQLNDIYNQVVLKGVQLNKITDEMNLNRICIYHDFEFDNAESFIKLISFKIANSSDSIELIEKELRELQDICCYRKMCILFVKEKYTSNQMFDLYHLKQPKMWKCKEITDIIVVSIDFKFNLEIVRFVNDLLYEIFNNTELAGLIIDKSSKETLIEIVRESLKALPISLD
ncbi:BglG family transcription antiterminator [Anaerorhabdus sp.]|uniref:BglG family transcription antiterminator n=1 Tax=Anaerorhabdus sp. TaxID=1872524 RepID=UPI002FCCB556